MRRVAVALTLTFACCAFVALTYMKGGLPLTGLSKFLPNEHFKLRSKSIVDSENIPDKVAHPDGKPEKSKGTSKFFRKHERSKPKIIRHFDIVEKNVRQRLDSTSEEVASFKNKARMFGGKNVRQRLDTTSEEVASFKNKVFVKRDLRIQEPMAIEQSKVSASDTPSKLKSVLQSLVRFVFGRSSNQHDMASRTNPTMKNVINSAPVQVIAGVSSTEREGRFQQANTNPATKNFANNNIAGVMLIDEMDEKEAMEDLIALRDGKILDTSVPLETALAQKGDGPHDIQIFMESMCPGSRALMTRLKDLEENYRNKFTIKIYNRGFLTETKKPDGGYTFTSKHGEGEVIGNLLLNCAAYYANSNQQFIDYDICVMTQEDTPVVIASDDCADEHGFDAECLNACSSNKTGEELLHEAGVIQKRLHPAMTTSPWVVINGMHVAELPTEL